MKNIANDPSEGELQRLLRNLTSESSAEAAAPSSTPELMSPFLASFYDGLWFFVEAFNRTLERKSHNSSILVAQEIFNVMYNGTFSGKKTVLRFVLSHRGKSDSIIGHFT